MQEYSSKLLRQRWAGVWQLLRMEEWEKPKLHYLAKVEVNKNTITPLGCCREPRNHICCLQWMSTIWQSSPNSASTPPVPPRQLRFLHSRKTLSFTDTTANLYTLMGETQQGESTSSSNQSGTTTSASSRAEDTGAQDTCRVFVALQPHAPAFQGSLAQRGTAPELLLHRAKGWRGINDHKIQHF